MASGKCHNGSRSKQTRNFNLACASDVSTMRRMFVSGEPFAQILTCHKSLPVLSLDYVILLLLWQFMPGDPKAQPSEDPRGSFWRFWQNCTYIKYSSWCLISNPTTSNMSEDHQGSFQHFDNLTWCLSTVHIWSSPIMFNPVIILEDPLCYFGNTHYIW